MKKTSTLFKLSTVLLQINNTLLKRCVLIFSNILILQHTYAQQAYSASSWKITNPFYSPVFIENKGQFNNPDGQKEGNVLYGINNGELKVYFTPSGLSYHITNVQLNAKYKNDKHEIFEKMEESIKKNGKPDESLKKYFDDKSAYVTIQWEGANPDTRIVVSDKVNDVYSFVEKDVNGNSVVASAFKKLTYKNIYPNIDIEYYFSGKNLNDLKSRLGVKYNVIVHPGGDLAKVKMKYSGMQTIKIDAKGNIIAEVSDGNMTDHSPDFSYVGSESKQVQTKFILQGQTVSFSVPLYDKTKQLVIDPFTSIWSVSPGFTTANDGYTIRLDYHQNVYVMGGGVSTGGAFANYVYQVKKFDPTGVLLWTASLPAANFGAYGDMTVLRSGRVIVGMGFGAGSTGYFLTATTGAITNKTCPGGVNEFGWRFAYNLVLNDNVLWAGGGSNTGAHLIKTDTNLTASIRYNPWNSTGGSVNTEDISYLALDPTSSFVYITNASNSSSNGVSGSTTAPNFCKAAVGTPATALWNKREPTLMMELGQGGFMNGGATSFFGGWSTGVNGMVVCGNAIYTFDGKNVRSYDPATGTITHSIATVGGVVDGFSGIAVDNCCRVYVGGSGKVYRYKDDLTLDTVIAVTGDVYDLQLDPLNDQHLCVTGKGFVQMLEGHDGSYCRSCITNTFVNATLCTKGSATVTVNDPAMTLPLNYSWNTNPIQTGSVVTGLDSGMYVVTVTDSRVPCPRVWKDTVFITGHNALPPITVNSATICPGGVATLTASGANTYTWSPASSVTPSTGSIVTVSPGVTTTFTVTGTFNGCINSATALVTVTQGALASFIANPLTGNPPLIVNFTNNSTNATTYFWDFGNGQTSTLTNPSTTYTNTGSFHCTLIAYNSPGICHDTISVDIFLEDPFSILIPNVFSPNNDNINDLFHITAVGFSEMNVIIYNRWGKLLYKYDGLNSSWDGNVSGKPVPDGVYYYIIEGQTKKNEKYNKSGFITLIR